MGVRFGLFPALLLGAVFALATAKTVSASAIYSYTGDPMGEWYGSASILDNGTEIAVFFTLPSVFPPDSYGDVIPLSFEISDGVYTFTDQTANLEWSSFFIDTDGAGDIVAIDAQATGPIYGGAQVLSLATQPGKDQWETCLGITYATMGDSCFISSSLSGGAAVYLDSQPGWTVTDLDPSSTPEPVTLCLTLPALLAIAFRARRRTGRGLWRPTPMHHC